MLITHGTLVTLGSPPQVVADGAIYVRGDTIADLGPTEELASRYPDAERLDADGKIVLPGNICAHTHFYSAFARGLSLIGAPPRDFAQILERLWWRLDRALDEEAVYLSALVSLADAIRHGTTTLIDHHASPAAIDGSLDILADAVTEAGLRACLCYEVTDRNGPEGARAGIRENARFIRSLARRGSPFLAGTFGLHASFTLSDETLALCRAEAEALGVGFHIHLAEDRLDQEDSLAKYGLRVGERLARHGVLGEKTLATHCVHIGPEEVRLLAQTGTKVSHQPRSNMNNAVGVADVPALMEAGICVGLGNDGFTNDMFAEMKAAYLVHKLHRRDPRALGADAVPTLAFAHNARIAGLWFPKPLGRLAVGAYADLVFLDYVPYTPLTAENFPWHLVFGIDGSHVTHTICGGKVLMKDRRLLTLDEEAIAARARAAAPRIWARFQEIAMREEA